MADGGGGVGPGVVVEASLRQTDWGHGAGGREDGPTPPPIALHRAQSVGAGQGGGVLGMGWGGLSGRVF